MPPVLSERFALRMDAPGMQGGCLADEGAAARAEDRWRAAGNRATLELPMRRERDALVVVSCLPALFEKRLARLRVELDGQPASRVVRRDLDPGCIVIRVPARSPAGAAAADVTELALVFPGAVSPEYVEVAAAGGGSPGLGISSVSVFPVEPSLPPRLWASLPDRLGRRLGLRNTGLLPGDFPYAHFDGLGYLEANPDVAHAVARGQVASALAHYVRSGRKSGRTLAIASGRSPNEGSIADCFDGGAYLARYPDVAGAVRLETMPSALEHFLRHGRKEGRRAALRFDQRATRGTALEVARWELRKANSDIRLAMASLADLQKNLEQIGHLSRERMEQVQAQLATLARARQAREREILTRLDLLEPELPGARLMARAGSGPSVFREKPSRRPTPAHDKDVTPTIRQEASGEARGDEVA